MPQAAERIAAWMSALETRQLQDLTFQEISRSLRALSSTYVERRTRLASGAALAGAGKRAAFALFYGPLHLLLVQRIVLELGRPYTTIESVLDLGCGTGASAAGWALACETPPRVTGVDRHPWAIEEARRTFGALQLRATFRVDDFARSKTVAGAHPRKDAGVHGGRRNRAGILLAFAVNELADASSRAALLADLLAHGAAGGRAIIVEPLAGFVAPWWGEWRQAFESAGGRADEWRFGVELPAIVEKLDRAAGLHHRELKARTLAL